MLVSLPVSSSASAKALLKDAYPRKSFKIFIWSIVGQPTPQIRPGSRDTQQFQNDSTQRRRPFVFHCVQIGYDFTFSKFSPVSDVRITA